MRNSGMITGIHEVYKISLTAKCASSQSGIGPSWIGRVAIPMLNRKHPNYSLNIEMRAQQPQRTFTRDLGTRSLAACLTTSVGNGVWSTNATTRLFFGKVGAIPTNEMVRRLFTNRQGD